MDTATMNLGPVQLAKTKAQVDEFNATLGKTTSPTGGKQTLGKNDFLKLLMVQLTHQDPTKPMSDTQFIAQMAQFSALEQMTNVANGFKQLNDILAGGQALSLLGRKVEVASQNQTIQGVVDAVSTQGTPQVKVGETYYNYSDVQKVLE